MEQIFIRYKPENMEQSYDAIKELYSKDEYIHADVGTCILNNVTKWMKETCKDKSTELEETIIYINAMKMLYKFNNDRLEYCDVEHETTNLNQLIS